MIVAFVSQIEPKSVEEALQYDQWCIAMQEELNQFKRNEVWELIPRDDSHQVIGTKWVFKNKLDEDGNTTNNKAKLVAKGYKKEGIDL